MSFNLALLGSGIFANTAYLPALSSEVNKEINLHTIWSRSEKSAKGLEEKAKELGHSPNVLFGPEGLEKVFQNEDIHAVSFLLPITTQPELILKALKHGKHVLSEKPVGKDVAAAKALIEEYEREYKPKGLIWRVAENWENDSTLLTARDLLKNDSSLGPILNWQFRAEGAVVDGSAYQATQWRTVPDYQGGFLLDGGVHYAAALRLILPDYARPSKVIATASLHRAHLPPHDTIHAIVLPSPDSTVEPHGKPTALETLREASEIPGGTGKSTPTGSVILTNALPDTPPETRQPVGLTITTVNAVVLVSLMGQRRQWTLRVIPGKDTGVKASEESNAWDGVENELDAFRKTVIAAKEGKDVPESARGEPRGPLWDVAFIQAMLTSNGSPVELDKLLA